MSNHDPVWMDIATPKVNMPCGGFSCDLSSDNLSHRKPLELQKCTPYTNRKVTVSIAPTESLGVSSVKEDGELDIQELGNSFQGTLHLNDSCEQQSVSNAISNHEMSESNPIDAKVGKSLNRVATFPFSREVQPNSVSIMGSQDPDSANSEGPAFVRSSSMPASSKLVSAMKGGREQSGLSLTTKLHVKWAPEVYDPPATSVSHTVKDHQTYHQSPKFRKKNQHKHKRKGKNFRESGSERKKANRINNSNKINMSGMRMNETNNKLLGEGCHQAKVEIIEYAASSQEVKCRSNFLGESLNKVAFSIAEA